MKVSQVVSILSLSAGMSVAGGGLAKAVTATVPGTFSQACGTGGGGCFSVTNTSASGIGIAANGQNVAVFAVGAAEGVLAQAVDGVIGVSVLRGSGGGFGVLGLGASDNPNAVGVEGVSNANTGVQGNSTSGNGVGGFTSAAGSGNAIFGDAGNSGTAWAGNFVGDVNVSGGYYANGGFVASDERLKKDIKDSSYGLEQLLKLRPVTYKWKENNDKGTKLGLIAQELQKVVPEVVGTNRATGMLAVEYTALIPVLIKAVQEQDNTIRRQARLNEEQERRIASLERAQKPVASSLTSGGIGIAGLGLGLLPLGLTVVRRRRRGQPS